MRVQKYGQKTNSRCGYCGIALQKGFHLDHVKHVIRTFGNEMENLL